MCFSPAFRQRLLRRPLGWLLALLALVALQAHAMQRIAPTLSMAGMDPELCSAMVVAATPGADPADAGVPAGAGSSHCQQACVGPLGGLDLLTVMPIEPFVPAGPSHHDAPTLRLATPASSSWPSGRPRAPPQP